MLRALFYKLLCALIDRIKSKQSKNDATVVIDITIINE